MPFGKHKGQKMDQVPTDYLNWLKKTDIDEDLAYTVQYHLRTENRDQRPRQTQSSEDNRGIQ